MYHAGCWHNELPSPMTLYNDIQIYVKDFVIYRDAVLDDTLSKVVRIFTIEVIPNFRVLDAYIIIYRVFLSLRSK